MDLARLFRLRLLRPAVTVLLLRIATMGFTTIVGIMLARILQPKEFGTYAYLTAIVALLNVPGSVGIPILLVRELPVFLSNKQDALANGIMKWGGRVTLLASTMMGLAGVGVILLTGGGDAHVQLTLVIALSFVVYAALTTLVPVQAAALRGLGKVLLSQIPPLLEQFLFIVAIVAPLIMSSFRITGAATAIYLRVGSELVAFFLTVLLLHRCKAALVAATPTYLFRSREWLVASLPFVLASGAQVINAKIDVAMVGSMVGSEAAGLYQIATKAPELLGIFYLTFGTIAAPRISKLRVEGAQGELQSLMSRGALYIAAGSSALSIVMLCGGPWLLGTIFGADYRQAYPMFAILCASRLIFNMFGLCDTALQMLGDQRFVARTLMAMAACNAALNVLLIHLIGLNGAAWATGVSLIGWNIILSRRLFKNHGIRSGIDGYVREKLLRVSRSQ